jgi:PadR family transcriptional regulator, regulatory protein PadR
MEPLSRATPATLDVLTVLLDAGAPTWGLAVIKASGRPAGSVYPILERLESSGWVTSEWADEPERSGPRRRYYELTADGARAARSLVIARSGAVIGRAALA